MNQDKFPSDDVALESVFPDVILGMAAASITAIVGGYLCGLVIDRFGEIGSISLWALGFLSGLATSKVAKRNRRWIAISLIVGCFGALLVAETFWIHWNLKGADTLLEAVSKIPLFAKEYQLALFLGAIFTFFGAQSAYRQVSVA